MPNAAIASFAVSLHTKHDVSREGGVGGGLRAAEGFGEVANLLSDTSSW